MVLESSTCYQGWLGYVWCHTILYQHSLWTLIIDKNAFCLYVKKKFIPTYRNNHKSNDLSLRISISVYKT